MLEVNQEDWEDIVYTLARMARNEDEIRELVWRLARTDWQYVFKEDTEDCFHCKKEFPYHELSEIDKYFYCKECLSDEKLGRCDRCKGPFLLQVYEYKRLCPLCEEQICAICDEPTLPVKWDYLHHVVCPACLATRGLPNTWERAESIKIATHRERAYHRELMGFLSIRDWIETLEYFQWRCAYCLDRPYEHLDHFIPLTKGGHTLPNNCVPACLPCNRSKGQREPERVEGIPQSALMRVKSYLETR